eukprot:5301564-Prymnesium_polylepis.1
MMNALCCQVRSAILCFHAWPSVDVGAPRAPAARVAQGDRQPETPGPVHHNLQWSIDRALIQKAVNAIEYQRDASSRVRHAIDSTK